MSDLVFVAGVGAVVTVNVMDKLKNGNGGSGGLESPLGPGVSVLSLTTALNVPDRDSPNSVLARLSRLALVARTDSRKGVQDLISETALELLRHKDYIVSVDSQYSHFARVTDAQRAFNTLSIGGRSKFDEETGKCRVDRLSMGHEKTDGTEIEKLTDIFTFLSRSFKLWRESKC